MHHSVLYVIPCIFNLDVNPMFFSRLLNVPVVFRLDTEGDGNNNQKSLKLFGHPNVLKLPSVMPASELASIIKRLVHTDTNYSILTVDGVVSIGIEKYCHPFQVILMCWFVPDNFVVFFTSGLSLFPLSVHQTLSRLSCWY